MGIEGPWGLSVMGNLSHLGPVIRKKDGVKTFTNVLSPFLPHEPFLSSAGRGVFTGHLLPTSLCADAWYITCLNRPITSLIPLDLYFLSLCTQQPWKLTWPFRKMLLIDKCTHFGDCLHKERSGHFGWGDFSHHSVVLLGFVQSNLSFRPAKASLCDTQSGIAS